MTNNKWRYWHITLKRPEDGEIFRIIRYSDSIEEVLQHAYKGFWEPIAVREATDWEIEKRHECFKL